MKIVERRGTREQPETKNSGLAVARNWAVLFAGVLIARDFIVHLILLGRFIYPPTLIGVLDTWEV